MLMQAGFFAIFVEEVAHVGTKYKSTLNASD